MSDEQVKAKEKDCNCICCKILKSECTKKFLATVLASFIGCSLALLAFAPPKPYRDHCPKPPMEYRMDRPCPQMMQKFENRHEFRGDRPNFENYKRHNEFRQVREQRPDFSGKQNFKRHLEKPVNPRVPQDVVKPVQPVQPDIPQ